MATVILWTVGGSLVAIFLAMLVWAVREDIRRAREEPKNNGIVVDGSTWVRYPTNPTDQAYNAWLNEHDLSTWPYEVQPGYDERKEGQA